MYILSRRVDCLKTVWVNSNLVEVYDTKYENKYDNKYENKYDTKYENKYENKYLDHYSKAN